jgi:lipoyl(octanoyl) transferase
MSHLTTRFPAATLTGTWLGRIDYEVAWTWQRERHELRQRGLCGDTIALLEHPPTYTLGRRSVEDELIYDASQRAALGIALYRVDRGGRSTYHGPGQLVGYPIVGLGGRYDVLVYLRGLETALIDTVAELGATAERDRRHTGVWVGNRKIAAIGVKITRGVTMHGFALNVSTDLDMFNGIVPCGIAAAGVTSVERETHVEFGLEEVSAIVARHLARVLDRRLVWQDAGADSRQPGWPSSRLEPWVSSREHAP